MSKKIALKYCKTTVSAEFPEGADLNEALEIVGGLLKALGYCWNGELTISGEE